MEENFKVRNLIETDYIELLDWWKWHRFPAPSRELLPDDISTGVMVSKNGENICAGFVYATSSSNLYWIEWIVSTYKVRDKQIRKEAIRILIDTLSGLVSEVNGKYIYTSLKNQNLVQSYLDCGFIKGSEGTIEMMKLL